MQLLEEYQELIERDAAEISYLWKLVQTFLYFLCAVSGYVCSILFYLIWQHTFNGNCPLWAKSVSIFIVESELDDTVDKDIMNLTYTDWWNYVLTDYDSRNRCKMYFTTCFLSCIFGTVWLTLFFICGKGGYYIDIFQAPWRIVPPAIIFNFIFAMITLYVTSDLEEGYQEFIKGVQNVFFEINDTYEVPKNVSECEIIEKYVENFHEYNTCKVLVWLQIFSGIMTWSWIGGLMVLILRVIIINDFKLLKIKIYEVPNNYVLNKTNKDKTEKTNEKQKGKKE